MDKPELLKRAVRQITASTPNLPLIGIVTELQKETCTIKLDSGLELTDIRLKVSYGKAENYIITYPKIGSRVMVISLTGGLNDLVIIKNDEVEKIEVNQNGLEVLVDSADNKVSIKNEETSLLELFQLIKQIIEGLKVYTPAGPSGTPLPDTLSMLNQFETKLNKLIK